MSFSSRQEYLERLAEANQMRVKENAPMLSRPTSPERRLTMRLDDIPEAVPGPNAFAQEAKRLERHRLEGNAFYQQEMQKRKVTPPNGIHPALRTRKISDPPPPPRESSCTTMSTFINAGTNTSPSLKLVPSESQIAWATTRGHIEERRERMLHAQSGSDEERTPVFIPTPKLLSAADFANTSGTPKKCTKEVSVAELPSKTPKKGFLEKLKITTNLRNTTQSPSSNTLASLQETDSQECMPVKAQAVLGTSPKKSRASLGTSPTKTNLPRSPSKRRGLFSRKHSNFADINASNASFSRSSVDTEYAPATASTLIKTLPTAISDPTHYSYQSKRLVSQTLSDKDAHGGNDAKKCTIARSQSLKYFDHVVPPTPPAKNTPPDEKARREAVLAMKSRRVPFQDQENTSSNEPTGLISTSDRHSPTVFDSYGHRETPTLVTRPSVYSLHASVVPNMTDASTFEEMKARIDGLGLEGFSMPPENVRNPKLGEVYSPSIYASEWAARPSSMGSPNAPYWRQKDTLSSHTKESSSGGEIPVYYPELAKDPSMSNMTAFRDSSKATQRKTSPTREYLDVRTPYHGRTHARDHSPSPRRSVDSTIFAKHVDDDVTEKYYDSPTSFSHASATPSPLQCLPTTVYTPPPRSSSRLATTNGKHSRAPETNDQIYAEYRNGSGIQQQPRSYSESPLRRNEVFDNAPCLLAQAVRGISRPPSPQAQVKKQGLADGIDSDVDVDPKKSSSDKSPSADKLDHLIDIVKRLNTRNEEITSMRDEMRATNARLDDRLAAVENMQQASPVPTLISDEGSSIEASDLRPDQKRVSTNVAHDFYRSVQGPSHSAEEAETHIEPTAAELSTISELKETNKILLEMVSGFAEKIQALEKKKTGGGA